MKIIGVKMVSYDKKDGNHVEGVELVYTFPSKRYDGVNADRQFIYMTTINENMGGEIPQPGDEIEFTYGRSRSGQAYVNGWTHVK